MSTDVFGTVLDFWGNVQFVYCLNDCTADFQHDVPYSRKIWRDLAD